MEGHTNKLQSKELCFPPVGDGYQFFCDNMCGYTSCLYTTAHYHCQQCDYVANELSQVLAHRKACHSSDAAAFQPGKTPIPPPPYLLNPPSSSSSPTASFFHTMFPPFPPPPSQGSPFWTPQSAGFHHHSDPCWPGYSHRPETTSASTKNLPCSVTTVANLIPDPSGGSCYYTGMPIGSFYPPPRRADESCCVQSEFTSDQPPPPPPHHLSYFFPPPPPPGKNDVSSISCMGFYPPLEEPLVEKMTDPVSYPPMPFLLGQTDFSPGSMLWPTKDMQNIDEKAQNPVKQGEDEGEQLGSPVEVEAEQPLSIVSVNSHSMPEGLDRNEQDLGQKEETEDNTSESELSIEGLEEESSAATSPVPEVKCLVCDETVKTCSTPTTSSPARTPSPTITPALPFFPISTNPSDPSDASYYILSAEKLLTSATRVCLVTKLAQVMGLTSAELLAFSDVLCRRCYRLVQAVDYLEDQLRMVRGTLMEKYHRTLSRRVGSTGEEGVDEGEESDKGGEEKEERRVQWETTVQVDDVPKEESRQLHNEVEASKMCEKVDDMETPDENEEPFAKQQKRTRTKIRRKGKSSRYVCEECGKFLCDRSSLRDHMRRHRGSLRFSCDICDKAFCRRRELSEHIRTHTGEKPFCCSKCARRFSTKSNCTKHERSCVGAIQENVPCEKCLQTFCSRTDLGQHMTLAHSEDKINNVPKNFKYRCSACDKGFMWKCDLTMHVRLHSGDKPYTCDTCGMKFSTKSNCNVHVRHVHSGERPFVCDTCGKGFTRRATYQDHLNIHTGSRPYKCDDCGIGFSNRSNLRQHSNSHSEKRFLCPVCGKMFCASASLKVHMRLHNGNKPYGCLSCGREFVTATVRNRHTLRCQIQQQEATVLDKEVVL